eukprot:scaffold65513_cov64-Phaeocystis_antarctica.AAC.13
MACGAPWQGGRGREAARHVGRWPTWCPPPRRAARRASSSRGRRSPRSAPPRPARGSTRTSPWRCSGGRRARRRTARPARSTARPEVNSRPRAGRSQIVGLPLEPAVATALLGARLLSIGGVGGHGARHARARAEAVGERAADGRERQVVVGAARERHVQVTLGLNIVEHRDVGEQVVAVLCVVDEVEPAGGRVAVHEDGPVGEGVVVAHDVRQVGVLLLAHVGKHHDRCIRRGGGASEEGRLREGHKPRARLLVHRAHCGKGVGPADVFGVPHHHHLQLVAGHLLLLDGGQHLGAARAARASQ